MGARADRRHLHSLSHESASDEPDHSNSLPIELLSLVVVTMAQRVDDYHARMGDDDGKASSAARGSHRGKRDALDTTFDIAIIIKGLDGVLELVGGLLLLLVPPATINSVAHRLTQHELSQDPHDFFAHHLLGFTTNLHKTQLFGSLYLLTHGVAKIVIVGGLLKRRPWAYPFAFIFLGGFVVYQIYRMTFAPSIGLALLTVFDLFIIWLTWREYRRDGARPAPSAIPAQ
jgi:uncharacterized membrane protein